MVFSGEQMSALAPHRGRRTAVPRRVDAIAFARGVSARAPAPVDTPTTVFLSRSANKFASVTSSLVHRNQNVVVTGVAASAASSKTKTTTEKKDDAEDKLTIKRLMERRPIAVVTHVLGTGLALFLAGGTAGALAKTCTAPLDRLKIIMQISGANQQSAAAQAAAKGGLVPAFIAIGKSEGIKGYWKGNVPQVIRILPYSTAMLNSYEFYKLQLTNKETGKLSVPGRLASGAAAACTATLVTYPLDIIRLRLSIDPNMKTMTQVVKAIIRDEGPKAFFKGLPATCLSISPYSALNFCAFDMFKKFVPEGAQGIAYASFGATLLASGTCYPLDTIRRQMQLKSSTYTGVIDAGVSIIARDGVSGMFKGFLPNIVKNAPNKSIQLTMFDLLKRKIAESEKALLEEKEILKKETKGGKKKK